MLIRLTPNERIDAVLAAYERAMWRVGTKIYLPVSVVRQELRLGLRRMRPNTAQLDEILRETPSLLSGWSVTFAPFSGPNRGGLKLNGMYAGFVSIRPLGNNKWASTG